MRPSLKESLRIGCIGALIAVHWVCFFGAVKYANVSIALVCMASAGIFTAILEPLILRIGFKVKELLLGLLALAGMYLIYSFETEYATGIGLGIIAAILSSLFTVLNKQIVDNYNPRFLSWAELFSAWIFLSLMTPFYLQFFPTVSFWPQQFDWLWLIILALCCTVWAQTLAMSALRKISSFTAVLSVNLEPVYGIIMAVAIFNEHEELGKGFWYGIVLVALSVIFHSLSMMPKKKLG